MEEERRNEDAIERMWRRPKSWVNLGIVAVNILIFILVELTGSSLDGRHMIKWGAAFTPRIRDGEYYRLFTCMFLHFGLEHLFNNMLLLIFIGDYLERLVGKLRYLIIYLVGGMAGSLLSYLIEVRNGETIISAGASGAIFAVVGAMLVVLLRHRGRVEDLSLQRMLIMAALSIYVGFTESGTDNAAHVGGLIAGFFLCLLLGEKRKTNEQRKSMRSQAGE